MFTRNKRAAAVAAAVLIAGLGFARSGRRDVREIHLTARGMAYVDASTGATNPTLHVARGERIRLVLTNDDAGYTHNLVIQALQVSTPLLPSGQTQAVDITVPDNPGRSTYACAAHAEMMQGNIAIE